MSSTRFALPCSLSTALAGVAMILLSGCAHAGVAAPTAWVPPSYFADEHYAELAGVQTCYLEAGPPEAETIVFVHGWSGNVQNWWDQFEHFQSQYHVVVFDAPGHGKSERGAHIDYSMQLHVDVLAALMDELELEHATIVGNSGGGWAAARFAMQHPERVDKLVLSDSTGTRFRGAAGAVLNMISARWLEKTNVTSGIHYPGLDPKSQARQAFVVSFEGTVEEQPYLEALAMLLPPMYEKFEKTALATIEAPTLLLWGDDDAVVPINAMKVFDHAIPQTETYVLHLGGHTPMMNSPDEFNCAMAAFLAGQDSHACKQYALDAERRRDRLAGRDSGPHYQQQN